MQTLAITKCNRCLTLQRFAALPSRWRVDFCTMSEEGCHDLCIFLVCRYSLNIRRSRPLCHKFVSSKLRLTCHQVLSMFYVYFIKQNINERYSTRQCIRFTFICNIYKWFAYVYKQICRLQVNKAYSVLGVIKRNFQHVDKVAFVLLYEALVRSRA